MFCASQCRSCGAELSPESTDNAVAALNSECMQGTMACACCGENAHDANDHVGLEQTHNLAFGRQVDLGRGGNSGQARHGHDVAAAPDHKLCASGKANFTHVDGMPRRRATR